MRVSVFEDLPQSVQQPRNLRRHVYSLAGQGYLPAQMKVSNDQYPLVALFEQQGRLVSNRFDGDASAQDRPLPTWCGLVPNENIFRTLFYYLAGKGIARDAAGD